MCYSLRYMGYIFLIIAFTANACGNILVKLGSTQFASIKEAGILYSIFQNYTFLAGISLFALNIIFYVLALSRLPLSLAYMVATAGTLLLVTLSSVFYLNESLTTMQMVGFLLLFLAVVLITYR